LLTFEPTNMIILFTIGLIVMYLFRLLGAVINSIWNEDKIEVQN